MYRIISLFLLLALFGCADTYYSELKVPAKMTTIEQDAIERIKDFTRYKSRVTDNVETSIKFSIGELSYVQDVEIPYTTALEIFKNNGDFEIIIIVKRDSMATSVLTGYIGTERVMYESLMEGRTAVERIISQMDKERRGSTPIKKPEQKLNDNDSSTVAEETSSKKIGGID